MQIEANRPLEEILLDSDESLQAMFADFAKVGDLYRPSRFWDYYTRVHVEHLNRSGVGNFKRTVNLNYFNWTIHRIEEHLSVLREGLRADDLDRIKRALADGLQTTEKPSHWSDDDWARYTEFLVSFWLFVKKHDNYQLLDETNEPVLGNPLACSYSQQWVSQDICNSILELNAIGKGIGHLNLDGWHIAELGAGYGRILYVLLSKFKNLKVTVIDIPPALQISQFYLTELFPEKGIFTYRKFDSYAAIKDEFENASIAFLMPHQVEMLPSKSIDLVLNVSSLHEMTKPQIQLWFNHFDRLCKGYFYTKQWKESKNSHDEITIRKEEYPVKPEWKTLLERECPVQKAFFEAVYSLPGE